MKHSSSFLLIALQVLFLLALIDRQRNWIFCSTTTTTRNDSNSIFSSAKRQMLKNPSRTASDGATTTPHPSPTAQLRDIHMVMIGDSVMRYQYMSLVYRLRYGVWFHQSMWHYDLVNEKTFYSPFHPNSWGEYLFRTNQLLQPNEVCDCRRMTQFNTSWALKVMENRFYYDPILNNSIVYLIAFGHAYPLRGRLAPNQVRQQQQNHAWQVNAFQDFASNVTWQYHRWSDAIEHYVRRLDPQPRHIILNAGLWGNRFGWAIPPTKNKTGTLSHETESMLQVMNSTPDYNYVWRTTSYRQTRDHDGHATDAVMCDLLTNCLNVSFTRQIRGSLYVDYLHFTEPVYRLINEEMLDMLGYLPGDYSRMNLSEVL